MAIIKNRERTSMRSSRHYGKTPTSIRWPYWYVVAAPSTDLEIFCRFLAAVGYDFILNSLPFIEGAQARTFDCRDVNEHILAAALRLNKPVAFGWIEPLHGSCSHCRLLA